MRRHPFPVEAFFERVVAVSFAFPSEQLRPLVPEPLEVDTYEGLGFITVALVWTRGLRPAALPRFLGQDFFLAGYRVFVRMRNDDGRRLRRRVAQEGRREANVPVVGASGAASLLGCRDDVRRRIPDP